MSLYADSIYPVREDVAATHALQFEKLGSPGTWGTAAQRVAIVNEAREAGYQAGVMEKPNDPGATPDVKLSEAAHRVVHRLAVSPKDMDQAFYDKAIEDGLSDVEYVEIVGLIARFTCFDVLARGIGVPLRPLPQPQGGYHRVRGLQRRWSKKLGFQPYLTSPTVEKLPRSFLVHGSRISCAV